MKIISFQIYFNYFICFLGLLDHIFSDIFYLLNVPREFKYEVKLKSNEVEMLVVSSDGRLIFTHQRSQHLVSAQDYQDADANKT